MSQQQAKNYTASARHQHARLLQKAKQQGETFNLLLIRYAVERLLHGLAKSQYSNQFILIILKGAKSLQFGTPHSTEPLRTWIYFYSTNEVSSLTRA